MPIIFIYALLFVIFVVVLFGSIVIYQRQKRPPVFKIPYTKAKYSFFGAQFEPAVNRKKLQLNDQDRQWQSAMLDIGKTFLRHQLKGIYLLHGTFVGNDPLEVIKLMSMMYSKINSQIIDKLQKIIKVQNYLFLRDNGVFLPDYAALMQKALGDQIPCLLFTWSSGNHHAARLKGALQLMAKIAEDVEHNRLNPSDRILLIGHSHAGQVFALLTHLLEYGSTAKTILAVMNQKDITDEVHALRNRLCDYRFDFVTLGMPPRYAWSERYSQRLLHLVNHRGHYPIAGSLSGILTTRDGDYVQQWGIEGSDILAATSEDRDLNKSLDNILGVGCNVLLWSENIKKRQRVSPYGFNYLIDYHDYKKFTPNCLNTFFGHGIYTKFEVMVFNLRVIANHFY